MKIIIRSLMLGFTLTIPSFLVAMEGKRVAAATAATTINWEAFGTKVRLSKTLALKLGEDAPEEIRSLMMKLNGVRNRYFYGAALDEKIDTQLRAQAQEIYKNLRQWNRDHPDLPQWQPDIDNYSEGLSIARLAGAFEIAQFYYRGHFDTMAPDVRTYLENRVLMLLRDDHGKQPWVQYCFYRVRMAALHGELTHLLKAGITPMADRFLEIQTEIEQVIHGAQIAMASIKSSKLDRDNLAHEVETLRNLLDSCR